MALTATIFKADLQVSDLDRGYYANHPLTLARHPSETDERLMVRLLAFALNADDSLNFGKGISNSEEPALWQHWLSGEIATWIDVGQPDPDRLRKACGRADRVLVYSYGSAAGLWWKKNQEQLQRFAKLSVIELPSDETRALATLVQRTMQLNCTIQDNEVWIGDDSNTIELHPKILQPSTYS
jgi:uncharacterized protein YaeQ